MQNRKDTDISTSSSISNAVFFIPFAYYYRVRLQTIPKLLSWMLIYLLPVFWYSWMAATNINTAFIVTCFCILIAVFSLYEAGYIHNDTFATRKELNPTLRLAANNLSYFYSHYKSIFFFRLLYSSLALTTIFIIDGLNKFSVLTALSIAFVPILFFFYNHWRNKYNVFLYPLLVFSRYLPFLLPYDPDCKLVLLLFFVFPFPNMIERFSMPKYRFRIVRYFLPRESSKTIFRTLYYIIVVAILSFVLSHEELLPFYILAVYRTLLLVITRFYSPKRYLQG